MKQILTTILAIAVATLLHSCIEDGYTASPSQQPRLECDTLFLGDVFTGEATPTARFKIFNPHDRILNIDRISLREAADVYWRMNVDGVAGNTQDNVEIRPHDSIFVFIETTLPDLDRTAPAEYNAHIDINVKSGLSTVVINALGRDATRLAGKVIDTDTRLDSSKPYIVYDSLVVAPGVTLTLAEGTSLHFHDKAMMRVDGTLVAEGTPGHNVQMTGDRRGTVVGRVDYEIMSGQWDGLRFSPSSRANRMEYTSVRNTVSGVIVDSVPFTDTEPSLTMVNCQLRNSQGYALVSSFSSIVAHGCELADAALSPVALQGGKAWLTHCTIANYYLFVYSSHPTLAFYHAVPGEEIEDVDLPLLSAQIDNCIIYGYGPDLSHGDLDGSEIYLRNTLLKSDGSDDDHFINCLWDTDPMYCTVRSDYYFDYRLQPESPALSAADPALTPVLLTADRYGIPRSGQLGAYSLQPAE